MSALGQKRTLGDFRLMSALPPKADMDQQRCDVRLVPLPAAYRRCRGGYPMPVYSRRTGDAQMPTYIDIHDLPGGLTAEDLAKAHLADQRVQGKHGVEYHKYWVNRKSGKLFCMCTAPSAEAAAAVHQEAHGQTALKIMEVTSDIADAFMGASEVDEADATAW